MPEITANPALVAYCGLYCGACGFYLKGKCPGCHENAKATWCQVRACNREYQYSSCADCKPVADVRACAKHNNFMSKVFALIFRSDRAACVDRIKKDGYPAFAKYMAANKLQSIKR